MIKSRINGVILLFLDTDICKRILHLCKSLDSLLSKHAVCFSMSSYLLNANNVIETLIFSAIKQFAIVAEYCVQLW